MNIVFTINGGIGKSIVATAVCKAIKKKYPQDRLIVITGYPDVFLNLPYVDMAFNHGQEYYFFEKYIQGQEVKIFANEPYFVTEHILLKEHLIETWCRMYDISYDGEMPEVVITEREATFYANKYIGEKPIFVIQSNGGANSQEVKYSWARDIPQCVVKAIIEEYAHSHRIYHIRRDDQFGYDNTIAVQESYKGLAVLIGMSQKRLLMDSFAQHLAKSLNLKSTVLWVGNSPKVFGYDLHDNILANQETKKPDLRNAFFTKYNISGSLQEFPYETDTQVFNIDKVLASLRNL